MFFIGSHSQNTRLTGHLLAPPFESVLHGLLRRRRLLVSESCQRCLAWFLPVYTVQVSAIAAGYSIKRLCWREQMSDSVQSPTGTVPTLKSSWPILSTVSLAYMICYSYSYLRWWMASYMFIISFRLLVCKSPQKLLFFLPPPPPGTEIETLIELCEEFETPEECEVCIYWVRMTTFPPLPSLWSTKPRNIYFYKNWGFTTCRDWKNLLYYPLFSQTVNILYLKK